MNTIRRVFVGRLVMGLLISLPINVLAETGLVQAKTQAQEIRSQRVDARQEAMFWFGTYAFNLTPSPYL